MSRAALIRDLIFRYRGEPESAIREALRDPVLLTAFPPYTGPLLKSNEERLLASLIICPRQFEISLVAQLKTEDFDSPICAEVFDAVCGAFAEDPDFELVDVGVRVTTQAAREMLPHLDVTASVDFAADGAARYARLVLLAAVEREAA